MAHWQGLLAEQKVDVLICGGIGGGARLLLQRQVWNYVPEQKEIQIRQ